MKNKLLLLSLITVTNLMALNMDEAVEKALNSSHTLKSQEHKIGSSKANEALLGASYRPTASVGYSYANRDFSNFMKTSEESVFNVSVDYNLFNGFYDKYTLESQKHQTASQKWLLQSNIADLKQLTRTRYLNLLQALKSKTVQDEAVTLLEKQLQDSQNLLNQEMIAKSKYLKVKVELQSTKQAQLQASSSVTNAKNALASLIQENIHLEELQEPQANHVVDTSFDNLYTKSLEKRSELKYLEALKKSQESSIDAVNSVYYPKVGLALDYNKYGDEVLPNGVSYGALGSMENEVVGSVNISYDLYSGGKANSQRMIHKSQVLSLTEDIEQTKRDIKLQLQQALEQLKVSQGQIEVAQGSIVEAQEHYRITNNRYKQQLDSTTDLLDARLLLTTAQNNLTLAEYAYQQTVVDIERVLEE
ncbi:MAG: TolC family protein [Epsilonproteobacteria bacterium]|nr:TolC family protein [Campylobacterota bacterium]